MPVFLCLWYPLDIRSQDSNINLQLVVSGYNIQSSNPYFEQKLFTGFSPGLELNIGKSNRISYSLGFRLFQDSILRPITIHAMIAVLTQVSLAVRTSSLEY
jgi:hypothetical protein